MTLQPRHDRFFRRHFSDPHVARVFFKENLPQHVLDRLKPNHEPVLLSESYIDPDYNEFRADIVYQLALKTETEAPVLIALLEHKSYEDKFVGLQLLRYMLNIWSDWREKHGLPLPIVLPCLIVHGKERWRTESSFAALFGPSASAFAEQIPNFFWKTKDVGALADSELSEDPSLRALFLCLKYFFRPDLNEHLVDIVVCASGRGPDFTISLLRYILHGQSTITEEGLDRALQHTRPHDAEKIMSSLPQKWYDEGEERGIKRGIEQGIERGETQFFQRLLLSKFGPLPDWVEQRLQQTDKDTLERWGTQLLTAKSLEDVFL